MNDLQFAYQFAKAIEKVNGRAYYVGGYVRDQLLHIDNKDIDIEVHQISIEQLEHVLQQFGEVIYTGKSFGVYGVKGYHVDIALPRKEVKVGDKHNDFQIQVDPYIGLEKACSRRDFTMNAMMQDILTNEMIDFYHGQEDLQNHRLRHVNDEKFQEDPLRVYRCAQFAARFDMKIASETISLCQSIDTASLSKERVEEELKKALLKADQPSIFFTSLLQMNQLHTWFPELMKFIDLPQNPIHHPEGDVWNHTMMVLDAGVSYRDQCQNPYYFMMACLCHDLGKIVTTEFIKGAYHAYGHENKGDDIARVFIRRISNEKLLLKYVLNMMKLHMKPHLLYRNQSRYKKTNQMFDASIAPQELIYLSICDNCGKQQEISESSLFLQERLLHYQEWMAKDYIKGKDLMDAGLQPDARFSELLAYAHKLRLSEIPKEEVLKQTLVYAKKL